jgi:hypothetical protein
MGILVETCYVFYEGLDKTCGFHVTFSYFHVDFPMGFLVYICN